MKIAVLGSNGFVGSSLTKHLSNGHLVIPVTRKNLNLLDPIEVRGFLNKNKFDVVINAAATMQGDTLLDDTRNNLGLFMNFYNNADMFGKFINLGSGAEFDRSTNIDCASENTIFDVLPNDCYGFGQNMKSRISYQTNNFYTIRIFNCFGKNEIATRIFPRFIKNPNDFQITNDRYFDYFSIWDLFNVVDHCIENTWTIKDVNAVYTEKFKISDVLEKFCRLNNLESNFSVVSTSMNNYTGSGDLLASLDLNLKGLDFGLKTYMEK
jgi:GDP-L-fucose synthase